MLVAGPVSGARPSCNSRVRMVRDDSHGSKAARRALPAGAITTAPAKPSAEVNAVEWATWNLVNSKGQLRFPGFPPVAYVSMEASPPHCSP